MNVASRYARLLGYLVYRLGMPGYQPVLAITDLSRWHDKKYENDGQALAFTAREDLVDRLNRPAKVQLVNL